MKTDKTKTATTIMGVLVIGLIMSSPMMILPNVGAVTSNLTPDCVAKATQMEISMGKQVDESKAKALAKSNAEFSSRSSGYSLLDGGIFNTWTIDKGTCMPTLESVNVVYYLDDSQGKYQKNLVFSMDPQLTKVTKIDEYVAIHASSTSYSYNWSGYEFAADSTHSTLVTDAYATFTVPSISKPTNHSCYQNPDTSFNCHLAVWDGLMDNWGSLSTHLVQAGTDSIMSCDSNGNNCSTTYSGWWEVIKSGAGSNSCLTPSAGDAMTAEETQDHFTSSTYYLTITDNTSSRSCSHTETGYAMTSPSVAPFIDERPAYVDPVTHVEYFYNLAKFGSNSITGDITYNSAAQSIYTPYSNGYYTLDYMTTTGDSSGTKFITPISSVGTTGSFTQTWNTS